MAAWQSTLASPSPESPWGGALAGIELEPAWTSAPRWLGGTVYLALGWVAVVATPQLFARLGVAGGLLIVTGGLVYSAGAAVYALRRPDPIPAVFGLKRRLSDAVYRCLLADQRDRPYLAVKSG